MPIRKLKVKPISLGPYSHGIVLPAWWFKLNENPKELEIGVSMDLIEIRPLAEEKRELRKQEASGGKQQ